MRLDRFIEQKAINESKKISRTSRSMKSNIFSSKKKKTLKGTANEKIS